MTSVALLLLRLVAGGTLTADGYPKWFGGPGQKPPEPMTKLLGSNYAAAVMVVPQPELAA